MAHKQFCALSQEDQALLYENCYISYLDGEERGDEEHMQQCAIRLKYMREQSKLSIADAIVIEVRTTQQHALAKVFLDFS